MPYELKSQRQGFSATFLCATATVALTQLRRARKLDYPTITVHDEAGRPIDEAELLALIAPGAEGTASRRDEPAPTV